MAFCCIHKPPCKTATGRIRSFQTIGNCIKHFKEAHHQSINEEQVVKYCMIGATSSLVPFKPDIVGGNSASASASASAPMDVASVALSSIGSLGLSAMGINSEEQAFLMRTLAEHRRSSGGASSSAIDEGDDEEEEEEVDTKSTKSSSRLKIVKKLVKSNK